MPAEAAVQPQQLASSRRRLALAVQATAHVNTLGHHYHQQQQQPTLGQQHSLPRACARCLLDNTGCSPHPGLCQPLLRATAACYTGGATRIDLDTSSTGNLNTTSASPALAQALSSSRTRRPHTGPASSTPSRSLPILKGSFKLGLPPTGPSLGPGHDAPARPCRLLAFSHRRPPCDGGKLDVPSTARLR